MIAQFSAVGMTADERVVSFTELDQRDAVSVPSPKIPTAKASETGWPVAEPCWTQRPVLMQRATSLRRSPPSAHSRLSEKARLPHYRGAQFEITYRVGLQSQKTPARVWIPGAGRTR